MAEVVSFQIGAKAGARNYQVMTGTALVRCDRCKRPLTDASSIRIGMGPFCALRSLGTSVGSIYQRLRAGGILESDPVRGLKELGLQTHDIANVDAESLLHNLQEMTTAVGSLVEANPRLKSHWNQAEGPARSFSRRYNEVGEEPKDPVKARAHLIADGIGLLNHSLNTVTQLDDKNIPRQAIRKIEVHTEQTIRTARIEGAVERARPKTVEASPTAQLDFAPSSSTSKPKL